MSAVPKHASPFTKIDGMERTIIVPEWFDTGTCFERLLTLVPDRVKEPVGQSLLSSQGWNPTDTVDPGDCLQFTFYGVRPGTIARECLLFLGHHKGLLLGAQGVPLLIATCRDLLVAGCYLFFDEPERLRQMTHEDLLAEVPLVYRDGREAPGTIMAITRPYRRDTGPGDKLVLITRR